MLSNLSVRHCFDSRKLQQLPDNTTTPLAMLLLVPFSACSKYVSTLQITMWTKLHPNLTIHYLFFCVSVCVCLHYIIIILLKWRYAVCPIVSYGFTEAREH